MPARDQSGFSFVRLPAELRLLLLCLRRPPLEDAETLHGLAASPGFDWERFLVFARHHRVEPLVYQGLTAHGLTAGGAVVPDPKLADLRAAANANAIEAFRYLAEAHRLCALFASAGIPVRVLKGVPLSQRAYGDPGLRHVGDIDLLIPPSSAQVADSLLQKEGFLRIDPAARLTPRRLRSWQRHGKDYTYAGVAGDFELDLHWRLFRNPLMPGNTLADVSPEPVSFGGMAFSVLPVERSFLFLCVHGALEGWPRFKSLVDVAALWRNFTSEQQDAVIELARHHDVLPELAAALSLAVEFRLMDDSAVPAPLQIEMAGREPQWILRYARAQQLEHGFLTTQDRAGSWTMKRYEWGLRRGVAYRLEILRRILQRPRMWARFDLPDSLFWLYPLLSPVEWMLFHRRDSVRGTPARVSEKAAPSRWLQWRMLSIGRKWLLAEAFVALTMARGALSVLPARYIFHWLERPVAQPAFEPQAGAVESIRWAVLTVARHAPVPFVCFPQALAAHAMLLRRGIPSVMHYGVRRSADRQMRAHTWLEAEGRMLLGGESAPLYASIHSTGASREIS